MTCRGCGLDGWHSIPGRGKYFSLLQRVQTYPSALSLQEKLQASEDDHSALQSVDVKTERDAPPLLDTKSHP
jgi:hypothetical protein